MCMILSLLILTQYQRVTDGHAACTKVALIVQRDKKWYNAQQTSPHALYRHSLDSVSSLGGSF